MSQRLKTVVIAAIGATLFWYLNMPLPFLFGPMAACLLAALSGAKLQGVGSVGVGARTILGVAVGATVTPALINQLPQMAMSVAFIPLYIGLISLVGVPFFTRICGFDRVTAYYSAMPGGLQDMVIFGQEAGGDVRALSLVHATRVLIIVTAAPLLLTLMFGVSLNNPIGTPITDLPLSELLFMLIAAILGWKGAESINLFGATILGPMILSAVLSLSGLIHSRPPAEAILVAQFFIGLGIGVHYVGVTFKELRLYVASGAAFVLILAALAAIFSEIVVRAGLSHPVEGFLAFAPGGQAEMLVLAIVAGADLGFVVVHHVTRIILVIIGAPLMARLLRIKNNNAS